MKNKKTPKKVLNRDFDGTNVPENFDFPSIGIENIDKIISYCDGLMVARGDLGVEIPPAEVPLVQKELVKLAKKARIPVIIATQMMESMCYVTIYWHPKAMEKSLVAGRELGLKRRFLPELTRKEHHENRINFTSTRVLMVGFRTAVSAWE